MVKVIQGRRRVAFAQYSADGFMQARPRLVRHARLSPANRKAFPTGADDSAAIGTGAAADPIGFFLEVDYLPPSEVRP